MVLAFSENLTADRLGQDTQRYPIPGRFYGIGLMLWSKSAFALMNS